MFATGERVEGGMEGEVGFSGCRLLYIEWINKVYCYTAIYLLYSTKNYIQYPMINHNSKGYCKNVCVCVCVYVCVFKIKSLNVDTSYSGISGI